MRMDRINEMEQYILQNQMISLNDLASHFSVSMNTIRRDIRELITHGKVRKVYGGVTAVETVPPLPLTERTLKSCAEKQIIGQLAASIVQNNSTIFLDSGSTTPCILPYLSEKDNVTVVTYSLNIMYEAAKYPSLNIYALGGMFNHITASYINQTSELLDIIHPNAFFMAASAVSLECGLCNNTYDEFIIKERITRQNNNIFLMADHTKFDSSATYTFCRFSNLSAVITDIEPPKHYLDAMQNSGIMLYCP